MRRKGPARTLPPRTPSLADTAAPGHPACAKGAFHPLFRVLRHYELIITIGAVIEIEPGVSEIELPPQVSVIPESPVTVTLIAETE